ncbi:9712_t:CDS:2, partial [Dentiscutata erythropus]
LLMIACLIQWVIQGNSILIENWEDPGSGNPLLDTFNGICVGLLGITGFETSCNYIEDQKPGVFPKTIRNMWVLAFIFNAPISFLAITIMPLSTFKVHQNDIISTLGGYAAGDWLRIFITVDAVIVLGAGVLTGFVGVSGLIHRMASDHLLPQFLLNRNRFTNTYHWIILSFLVFCITLFTIVGGNVTSLSGVFAVSFLSVLCMFAVGNILLKFKRGRLYRPIHVSTGTAVFGFACILAGLIGNIIYDPTIAGYFAIYFGILFTIMMIMLNRVWLLKTIFFYLDKTVTLHKYKLDKVLIRSIKKLKQQPVVFFTKTDELHILNKAILYVKNSESSSFLKLIHIYEKIEDIPPRLEANHRVLDELYPKIQIDLIFIQGEFNPKTVECISKHLRIPK